MLRHVLESGDSQMTETQNLFKSELKAINLGLPSFAQDLKSLGVAVVHVDWRPIAGGNVKVINLLDTVKRWQSALNPSSKGGK